MRSKVEARKAWLAFAKYATLSELKDTLWENTRGSEATVSLRSLYWKSFLLFNSQNFVTWPAIILDSREAYSSHRRRAFHKLDNPNDVDWNVDPLSEDDESPWADLRKDEALRSEILLDVERCMPENTYFRQPDTQKSMLDILFVWCKLNADLGYRQGMHEVLAPILWVVETDAIEREPDNFEEQTKALPEVWEIVLNSEYVEHDSFTLFNSVMKTARSYYEPANTSLLSDNGFSETSEKSSPIIAMSERIFNELLGKVDPALVEHLLDVGVVPQIFLMRWIRLLFGREFAFDSVLQMWDLIFSNDTSLSLVEYICVAMILRIRWNLIASDTNESLTLLLRYPTPEPPQTPLDFVHDALLIKSNLSQETANKLVTKYTDKPIPWYVAGGLRPSTPRRQKESFVSYSGPSPLNSPPSASIETLLQDAARGVLSRSEKWGLNQAVRDAVSEVRRNVQNLHSGRTSPRARPSPGRDRIPSNRNSRSEAPSTIAANTLRKLNALDQRNKTLAEMLEKAVAELWDIQKEMEQKTVWPAEKIAAFGAAVAKIQFVQVFLQDSSMPLPTEELPDALSLSEAPEKQPPSISTEQATSTVSDPGPPKMNNSNKQPENRERKANTSDDMTPQSSHVSTEPDRSLSPALSIPLASNKTKIPSGTFEPSLLPNSPPTITPITSTFVTSTPPKSIPTISHSSVSVRSRAMPSPNRDPNVHTPPRPRLSESSFSWMLKDPAGEDGAGVRNAEMNGQISPRPFPAAVEGRRWTAAHTAANVGFLFGDADGEEEGERDGGQKSESRARERGKGRGRGKAHVKREDIRMGELGESGGEMEGKNIGGGGGGERSG